MIFPYLRGIFVKFQQAPLTWMLIYLNFIIFAFTSEHTPWKEVDNLQTAQKMVLTGQLYYQFENPKENVLPDRSPQDWVLYATQGLRDRVFVYSGADRNYQGDQIAIEQWKKELTALAGSIDSRKMNIYGLNGFRDSPLAWITYQFTHGGLAHLMMNCLVLLIFGAALERMLRPAEYLFLYIAFGWAAAIGFLAFANSDMVPLVGASGSISGFMTCYLMLERKKNVAFGYFIGFSKDYYGIVYLPVWIIWPLTILPDLVGYLSAHESLGAGIAYAAHLGGAVAGAVYGFIRRRAQSLFASDFQSHYEAP